jgi:hypothetical protein
MTNSESSMTPHSNPDFPQEDPRVERLRKEIESDLAFEDFIASKGGQSAHNLLPSPTTNLTNPSGGEAPPPSPATTTDIVPSNNRVASNKPPRRILRKEDATSVAPAESEPSGSPDDAAPPPPPPNTPTPEPNVQRPNSSDTPDADPHLNTLDIRIHQLSNLIKDTHLNGQAIAQLMNVALQNTGWSELAVQMAFENKGVAWGNDVLSNCVNEDGSLNLTGVRIAEQIINQDQSVAVQALAYRFCVYAGFHYLLHN